MTNLGGGVIQLIVTGEMGASYAVESSDDLATWTLWSQVIATARTTTVTERIDGVARFYRLVAVSGRR